MLKMDVHVDRASYKHDRADSSTPVENKDGVFALLDADELSDVEKARAGIAAETAHRRSLGIRNWLPSDVQKYLTRIYSRFSKSTLPNPQEDDT